MKRYAFIGRDGTVVNTITGSLSPNQTTQFLADYAVLYEAASCVELDDKTPVWIGGRYDPTSGEFSPPPQVEPEEEPINDAASIE